VAAKKSLKRSELYGLVWKHPMSRLAKSFALSDVGLAKICEKHDIPKPPRGYWAKKQFGQEMEQEPLPNPENDRAIEFEEMTNPELHGPNSVSSAVLEAFPNHQKSTVIPIAETLRGAHKLVTQTNSDLQGAGTDSYGYIKRPDNLPLDISTSKASLRRALLIMDAILKTLENNGHTVEAGPTVTLLGATLRFSISENLESRQEPDEDKATDGYYEFRFNRFKRKVYLSGKLTLTIKEGGTYWLKGCRYTWNDTEKHKLEGRLNQFLSSLAEMASRIREHDEEVKRQKELRRQEELRREEEARLRAIKRKAYNAEKNRIELQVSQAKDFAKARDIRNLVEAIKLAATFPNPNKEAGDITDWVAWATAQADRFDPTVPSPPSILDEKIPDDEPPRPRYYGQY